MAMIGLVERAGDKASSRKKSARALILLRARLLAPYGSEASGTRKGRPFTLASGQDDVGSITDLCTGCCRLSREQKRGGEPAALLSALCGPRLGSLPALGDDLYAQQLSQAENQNRGRVCGYPSWKGLRGIGLAWPILAHLGMPSCP